MLILYYITDSLVVCNFNALSFSCSSSLYFEFLCIFFIYIIPYILYSSAFTHNNKYTVHFINICWSNLLSYFNKWTWEHNYIYGYLLYSNRPWMNSNNAIIVILLIILLILLVRRMYASHFYNISFYIRGFSSHISFEVGWWMISNL